MIFSRCINNTLLNDQILDKKQTKILRIIKQNGQIHVNSIVKKSNIQTSKVIKILQELYDLRKISFSEKQNRKYYYILKKDFKNFDEVQEELDKELDIVKLKVNNAIELFQKNPNNFSLEPLIELGVYLLQWKIIVTIFKFGKEEKDISNNWIRIENTLNKLYSKILQQEPMLIKEEILKTEALTCNMLDSKIEGLMKYLSLHQKQNKLTDNSKR